MVRSRTTQSFAHLLVVFSVFELISLASSRAVGPGSSPRQHYGPPGTIASDTEIVSNTRSSAAKGPPGWRDGDQDPPGWGNSAQGPPGYELTQAQGPTDPDDTNDPFAQFAPPGGKGKETFQPGYKDAGPPAQQSAGPPGTFENTFPEGPQFRNDALRPSEGAAGPPSPNSVSFGPPRSSRQPGPPGSNPITDDGPPGTAAKQHEQAGAPGPQSHSASNQMAAQYFREPQRPLGIREPDTNLTIDQIITQVMGGPEALRVSSMVGANGTILAELDMRLTIDQYLTLYEHVGEERYESLGIDKMRLKRHAIKNVALRWLKNVIPYEFIYSDFNEQEVAIIKASMDEWQETTCLKFVPARPWHYNKIRFQQGMGCSSQVGMVGGAQAIYLDSAGCRWRGLFLHEIGHSIGLVHEHQLPERDNYLYIEWDKVDPVMKEWFKKYDQDRINTYGVRYNLASVMHYGVTAFSKDGKTKTIKVLDPDMEGRVGLVRKKELAHTDKHVVNLMYKCAEHCPSNIKCVEGAYLDKHCRCVCENPNNQCYLSGGSPDEEVDEDCEDAFTPEECKRWADYGECYLNPTWMALNCKKTCGKCANAANKTEVDSGCDDSNPKCTEWQKSGECNSNHYWMLHHCPRACGRCGQAECKNPHGDDKMCNFWASSGECQSNPNWMVDKCRKACDECAIPGVCGNLHHNDTDCRHWAGKGECLSNPDWMGQNCQRSCGLCEDSVRNSTAETCINSAGEDKCVQWAAKGECTANAAWMMINCRKACTKCLFIDVDDEDECLNTFIDDDQCDSWARSGECDRNADWMRELCTKSCKRCKKHLNNDCINYYLDEEKCDDWFKKGECLTNAIWMAANCNRSCSKCKERRPCINYFSDDQQCDDWAKIGECYANREWMIDNCYVACTDCDGGNRTRGRSCINRNNDDAKCDLWADMGECTHNRDWMMSKCYRSCSECDGISRDGLFQCTVKFKDEPLCWRWGQAGHCTSNRIWMIKNCRAVCKDNCSKFAPTNATGEETTTAGRVSTSRPITTTAATPRPVITTTAAATRPTNPATTPKPRREPVTTQPPCRAVYHLVPGKSQTPVFVVSYICPSPDCQDIYYDQRMCRVWAVGKQCDKNPSWMHVNCAKSCERCRRRVTTTRIPVVSEPEDGEYGVVGVGSGSSEEEEGNNRLDCDDSNQGCSGWARGGSCHSNPGYMYVHCKRACGLCDPANCVDKNPLCATWARTSGYCTINHTYMMPNCPRACGLCS